MVSLADIDITKYIKYGSRYYKVKYCEWLERNIIQTIFINNNKKYSFEIL